MDLTLKYYEENAQEFLARTQQADMHVAQERFLSYVPHKGKILDLGCGSGRDSYCFQQLGYQVEAVDGSAAMCESTAFLIKKPVQQLLFKDLTYHSEFDAVWASASLLHVPSTEIFYILEKVHEALKPNGIFYFSAKRGTFEGERNGRYFTDYTEQSLQKLLMDSHFLVQSCWTNKDVRQDRDETFINTISMKR